MRLPKNPYLRYAALGLGVALILVAALTPIASLVVEEWARQDVESRGRLVFRSIRDPVVAGLDSAPAQSLGPYLERITEDERLQALGFCDSSGALRIATRAMPAAAGDCRALPLLKTDSAAVVADGGKRMHVSIFPISAGAQSGHLLVVHDLSYTDSRARRARNYAIAALLGAALCVGLLGALIIAALTRSWNKAIRQVVSSAIAETPEGAPRRYDYPIAREIDGLLTELRAQRSYADGVHVDWSPGTLKRLLSDELPGAQIIVLSNREPYIHNRTEDGVRVQRPASGLVSALEPVMRACGGVWIAHGSGSADRETVDANDRIAVPPDHPEYSLRRLWLSEEEQDGYYYGVANEGLWPLCHIAFVRPVFRRSDWETYRAVNERFADAVAQEATCEDPIVLVHDYHFALAPRAIRKRLPKATIITFWHIPWPNAETFGICPWREEIIDGLLGSTILGFHTRFHCNNFIETVDRFIESRIDRETSSIALRGGETQLRPYPISIEWPPAALDGQPSVAEARRRVRERLGVPPEARIAVGIERFDYTKGILDRIDAVDELLTHHPECRGRFVLAQAAAPTRSKLGAYASLQSEAIRRAEEVNARHDSASFKPIMLLIRHHEPGEVYELFRAADMCIVSSLHDGMNLVAKEFVAARDDEQGVLILSDFAGASRELTEALIVNPYNPREMAEAMARALDMTQAEQGQRLRLMRDLVRRRNVHRWAGQMLLDASALRKRQAIGRWRSMT